MNDDAPTEIHARELTTLDSIPGSVTSALSKTLPSSDLFALDLGPSTSTERFSIPPIYEHVILMTVEGCVQAEARICGQFSTGQANPGRLALLPSGLESEWRICNGSCSNFNLFITPSLISRVAVQFLGIDPIRATLNPKFFFEDPLIFYIGMAISQTIRKPEFFDLLYLESLSHTLAVHLLHNYVSSPAAVPEVKGRLPTPVLKKILDYITDCSNAELTLAHMASLVHVSPYHFERLFKESMGQPVHKYVLAQRLKKSYRLLLGSNLTIAQIAAEAGFADESHFIRRFKAQFGVPPGALRKDRKIVL
jgi:AraC family transcriptional regulator